MSTPRPLLGLVFADWASTLEAVATVAVFVGSIAVGVGVFIWARNWRRRLAEESTTEEPIETYQRMLDEGLIDSQEFERIAARLRHARLQQPPDSAAPPSSPEPPSEPTP